MKDLRSKFNILVCVLFNIFRKAKYVYTFFNLNSSLNLTVAFFFYFALHFIEKLIKTARYSFTYIEKVSKS